MTLDLDKLDLTKQNHRLIWARLKDGRFEIPKDAIDAHDGWKSSNYYGHENGRRPIPAKWAQEYAQAYRRSRVRWEWIFDGKGTPTDGGLTSIIGHIEQGAKAHLYGSDHPMQTAELPPGGIASTVAIKVRGGPMSGIADNEWLFYFDHERRPPTADLVGKLCVVELANGDVLVRRIEATGKKGRYNLEGINESPLRNQRVVWAARVTWIKPR